MGLKLKDRIKETTSSTGTADFTLAGAVTNCRAFSTIGAGIPIPYTALDPVAHAWETGWGFYSAGVLSRVTILDSSTGSKISFTNSPIVWEDAPADLIEAISNPNKLINGDMRIDQRNAGASITPTGSAYCLDLWALGSTQSSKVSIQQNAGSVTPPIGFSKYLGVTSLSAYSVGASDRIYIEQVIEGLNIQDLGWGAAGALPVTLSFWVRSSLTGTFGGSLGGAGATRSYPFTYSIGSANTWELKIITVPGDTTGSWLITTGGGISLKFGLGVGSTFCGTAGSWAAADYRGATGETSVVGTNAATWYLTGVKLERGSVMTPFIPNDYASEIDRCMRYFQIFGQGFSAANAMLGTLVIADLTTELYGPFKLNVPMRATPTVAGSNLTATEGINVFPITVIALAASSSQETVSILFTVGGGGMTQFRPMIVIKSSAAGFLSFDAGL